MQGLFLHIECPGCKEKDAAASQFEAEIARLRNNAECKDAEIEEVARKGLEEGARLHNKCKEKDEEIGKLGKWLKREREICLLRIKDLGRVYDANAEKDAEIKELTRQNADIFNGRTTDRKELEREIERLDGVLDTIEQTENCEIERLKDQINTLETNARIDWEKCEADVIKGLENMIRGQASEIDRLKAKPDAYEIAVANVLVTNDKLDEILALAKTINARYKKPAKKTPAKRGK